MFKVSGLKFKSLAFCLLLSVFYHSCFPWKDHPEIKIKGKYYIQDQNDYGIIFYDDSFLLDESTFETIYKSENHLICLNQYRYYIVSLYDSNILNPLSSKTILKKTKEELKGPFKSNNFDLDSLKKEYNLKNINLIYQSK